MRTKVGLLAIFSLVMLIMITPAYASVISMTLEKSFYTTDEDFKLIGVQAVGLEKSKIIEEEFSEYGCKL